MKLLLILIGIAILGAVGFGIYKGSGVLSHISRVERTVHTSTEQAKALQDTLRAQAGKLAASGRAMYDTTSQQLITSGKQLVDEKKAQATDYLLQQKELLKQEAKKQVELEAQKKINAAFSGL